jgi:hypothetical protein
MALGEPMPRKTLTAVTVSKAQPRTTKYTLAAGGGPYLEVMPTGAKYWRWKYRHDGKEKRLALGVLPEVSLAQARDRRGEERAKLRDDKDPASQRCADKLAANVSSDNSFENIAREWMGRHAIANGS